MAAGSDPVCFLVHGIILIRPSLAPCCSWMKDGAPSADSPCALHVQLFPTCAPVSTCPGSAYSLRWSLSHSVLHTSGCLVSVAAVHSWLLVISGTWSHFAGDKSAVVPVCLCGASWVYRQSLPQPGGWLFIFRRIFLYLSLEKVLKPHCHPHWFHLCDCQHGPGSVLVHTAQGAVPGTMCSVLG